MITFIIYVLYALHAPWWVYVLSTIGALMELDSSDFVHRGDSVELSNKGIMYIKKRN